MTWRKRFRKEIQERQREADAAVITANTNYLDALNLKWVSERIARELLKEQKDNHFGPRLFGVEP